MCVSKNKIIYQNVVIHLLFNLKIAYLKAIARRSSGQIASR